jgi:putative ABC transport system substrate-binding protein
MNRRAFLMGSGAAISAVPPVRAQSTTGVVYSVGYLTGGTPATRAACHAAFREGNTTGVTNIVVELTGKRLELLREAVPVATRIAVFVNPDDDNARLQLHDAAAAASVLGVSLKPIRHIRRADDLDEAFRAATQARAHAVLRMVDPTVGDLRRQVGELALRYRLPVMCSTREEIEAGGLIACGVPLAAQYRQAARLVHKVLQGARPADLPVERATGFELTINLRTAKTLSLKMPNSLLARADKVIE